jgi:hypothetical protein
MKTMVFKNCLKSIVTCLILTIGINKINAIEYFNIYIDSIQNDGETVYYCPETFDSIVIYPAGDAKEYCFQYNDRADTVYNNILVLPGNYSSIMDGDIGYFDQNKGRYFYIDRLFNKSSNNKAIICGGNVQFDNPISNYKGSGVITYSWFPQAGLDNSDVARPTAEITSTATYFVTISTSEGCIAEDSVQVIVNPLTVNAGTDKSLICGGNCTLDNPVTNYTGSGILEYSWLPEEGLDDAMIPSPTVEITSDKIYTLMIETPNGCIAKDSVKVTVNKLEAYTNNVDVSCGNTAQLNVTSNYTGSGSLSYNWIPPDNLDATDISNPVANITKSASYSVIITTPNGCQDTNDLYINMNVINIEPAICMVTVDENNKNMIIWQKPPASIDSFFIYRESVYYTGVYELISKLSYSKPSMILDSFSNASIQSNRYRISIKDICGFTTDLSQEHKTMHLNINKGQGNAWNLIWEEYIGFDVTSYRIYRGTSKNNLELIGSTTSGNTSYSDFSAPSGNVFYQVEVIPPFSCNILKATSYNSSRSNIASNTISNISATENISDAIRIVPVPVKNELSLYNSSFESPVITITTMDGRIIMKYQLKIAENKIKVSELPEGVYILMLYDNKKSYITKFIKE